MIFKVFCIAISIFLLTYSITVGVMKDISALMATFMAGLFLLIATALACNFKKED